MAQIDPVAAAIGDAVHSAIKEAGLTLASFAVAAGFPSNSLSRRINGHIPFDYPELRRASRVTGVPVAEIVTRADRILDRTAA